MRAEQFDRASIEELQALANRCFEMARSPLEEPLVYDYPRGTFPVNLDDAGKLRLLLEAQFYLTAVARKRDEKVAERDRILEIAVIILIGVEIILSIAGIWIGVHEGNNQARVLSNIERSTKDNADGMSAAKSSLQILADKQSSSLEHLKQMDDSLKTSLNTTDAMASATRKQLRILQDEQSSRQSQLAKKPKFALYIGDVPISGLPVNFKPRTLTDTSISFDMKLVNEGTAIATRPLMRVMVLDKNISITVPTIPMTKPVEPPDSPVHVFLFSFDNIRTKVSVPMTITFTYPVGTKPFDVGFNIDADEIDSATSLGTVIIRPLN